MLASLVGACAPTPELETAEVVNGELTFDHPAVGMFAAPNEFGWCTGTLIGCDTVLTAAHCVTDEDLELGAQFFLPHAGVFEISSVAHHQDYDDEASVADIAVIRLATPVHGISPVQLGQLTPSVGTPGILVGYGVTGVDLFDSGLKRQGSVTVDTCPAEDAVGNPLDPASNVCWSYDGSESNSCYGDSGGPLLIDGAVTGVVVDGTDMDCLPGDQAFNSLVPAYLDFIRNNAGALGTGACGAYGPVGSPSTDVETHLITPLQYKSTPIKFTVGADVANLRVTANTDERATLLFSLVNQLGSLELCYQNRGTNLAACFDTQPESGDYTAYVTSTMELPVQISITKFGN